MKMEELRRMIRDVADFPQKGIVFKDITPLLGDPQTFRKAIDVMAQPLRSRDFDLLLGIESRGFLFASVLAYQLGKGTVPVRKPGKLPAQTVRISYDLEYGSDSLEIHEDAVRGGQRVVIVDDVLATGGTARGVADLVQKVGGEVEAFSFLIELDFLKGREKLAGYEICSVLNYL
ncbi:MAG TPA: adenine phosphoribosyltransferase [Vicinamibacteria bacterium]|nr:adenine phosphoribosyltransferase [Vicinamibacteria bacterium]